MKNKISLAILLCMPISGYCTDEEPEPVPDEGGNMPSRWLVSDAPITDKGWNSLVGNIIIHRQETVKGDPIKGAPAVLSAEQIAALKDLREVHQGNKLPRSIRELAGDVAGIREVAAFLSTFGDGAMHSYGGHRLMTMGQTRQAPFEEIGLFPEKAGEPSYILKDGAFVKLHEIGYGYAPLEPSMPPGLRVELDFWLKLDRAKYREHWRQQNQG